MSLAGVQHHDHFGPQALEIRASNALDRIVGVHDAHLGRAPFLRAYWAPRLESNQYSYRGAQSRLPSFWASFWASFLRRERRRSNAINKKAPSGDWHPREDAYRRAEASN